MKGMCDLNIRGGSAALNAHSIHSSRPSSRKGIASSTESKSIGIPVGKETDMKGNQNYYYIREHHDARDG